MIPSRKSSFRLCLTLLALTAFAALLGCRSIATTITRTLRLNIGAEPATLDPALATDPESQQITRMLFASLVDTDPTTGAPEHGLATSWAVSADGLIWEFRMRSDAIWVRYIPASDKVETRRSVTAHDVVYSVRRIFDPRNGSGIALTFSSLLRGAEQLRTADPARTSEEVFQRLFENLGVQALDDLTVRFTLNRPASYFPSIVSTWLVRTQPREAVEAGGSVWTEPGTIWTNGPYVLKKWRHGLEIVLKKNDEWHNKDTVRIDEISLAMIGDTASAIEEFKNGDLDSLDPYGGLAPTEVDRIKNDPVLSKQLTIVPTLCTHYYGFNTTKAPFNEPLVRKAFIAAIDRETLVTSVVKLGEPARWFTRPGVFGSFPVTDTVGIPFNVNQAREYLKQAGYDKRKFGAITLMLNTNETHRLIADTVVQMWKNNLGVEVGVKEQDWKSYTKTLGEDPPQIFRMGWCGYVPDAGNFTENVFRSGSPDNFVRWSSPRIDQYIADAARETDVAKRRVLYENVERLLVNENAVILPLWWSTRASLTQTNVQRTYAITDGYERLETWSLQ